MTRFIPTCLLATIGLCLANTASAADQSGAYITIGGAIETLQFRSDVEGVTATSLNARLGYDFGRYFGLEAEGAIGLSGALEDRTLLPDGQLQQGADFDYTHALGVFLKPSVPVSDSVKIFGRAGFGASHYHIEIQNPLSDERFRFIEDDRSEGYVGLGLGAEFALGETGKNGVRLDILHKYVPDFGDGDENESYGNTQFSVAYLRRF